MNYERIYSEFIADRLTKQPSKPEYFEKHHILPKCKGGLNGKENLIRLTPEDHFFAHLLLAKMHGGTMWAPVAFMVGGNRKDYKPTLSRVAHGWAAKAMAASITGGNAYQFDFIKHRLVDASGFVWVGMQSEMPVSLGISKSLANMLIHGKVSVAKGWSVCGKRRKVNHKIGSDHPMYRDSVHEFEHVDGRLFTGTQLDFADIGGMHRPAVCKLVLGKSKVWNGWHLKGATLPTVGRGAKWSKMKENGISITNPVRPGSKDSEVARATS